MRNVDDLPFVAGCPALDFVNTAELRGHPRATEFLQTAEDLRTWGVRYGLLDGAARSTRPGREYARAIEARELLYRMCCDRVGGAADDVENLEQLSELAADAVRCGRLVARAGGLLHWQFDDTELATVRHVAITSALELFGQTGTARLKQCPGDHCGWFFLDATKRGNRRWCLMSECGQDAKRAGRRARTDREGEATR
jgi:predicted RNA-binding Zn ribbon-like protein